MLPKVTKEKSSQVMGFSLKTTGFAALKCSSVLSVHTQICTYNGHITSVRNPTILKLQVNALAFESG